MLFRSVGVPRAITPPAQTASVDTALEQVLKRVLEEELLLDEPWPASWDDTPLGDLGVSSFMVAIVQQKVGVILPDGQLREEDTVRSILQRAAPLALAAGEASRSPDIPTTSSTAPPPILANGTSSHAAAAAAAAAAASTQRASDTCAEVPGREGAVWPACVLGMGSAWPARQYTQEQLADALISRRQLPSEERAFVVQAFAQSHVKRRGMCLSVDALYSAPPTGEAADKQRRAIGSELQQLLVHTRRD